MKKVINLVNPSSNVEETELMLFWSDEAYARQCAIEEWPHYKPESIPLE